MNHSKLVYGLITGLGIVFAVLFFPNPMVPFPNLATSIAYSYIGEMAFSGTATWVLVSCFCSILGAVFLPAGLCGICSHYFRSNQTFSALQARISGGLGKYSKLFEFVAVLGGVFLGAFVTTGFLVNYSAEVFGFIMSIYNLYVTLLFSCFFVGIGLLTIGVCGIARHHFKNYQNFCTILLAIAIPSLILMPLCCWWISSISSLTLGF